MQFVAKKFAGYYFFTTFAIPYEREAHSTKANPDSGNNIGELADWSNAAVLKTVDLNGSGGSNPSLSATRKAG